MTAKQVNGIEVIATEAVLSPLSTPEKPVRFKNILQLLLADETTVYGCGKEGCEFTDEKPGRVRLHFRSHDGLEAQVRKVDTPKFGGRKTKEKGKAEPAPEPAEVDENPIDFLAALERMFSDDDQSASSPAEVEELKARVVELEQELVAVKEELAKAAKECAFWKGEHAVAVGTVRAISEIIKRSKIK